MTINIYFDGDKNNIKYIIDDIDYNETIYDKCDFIISCKFSWGNTNFDFIQKNINLYNNYSKSVIIFLISDTCDKFTIPNNVFLFRTSLYKSQISKNEYILPYVWEKIDKSFILLKKTENPKIGRAHV